MEGPDLGVTASTAHDGLLRAECRRESTPFTLIRGFDERLLRGGPDRLYAMLHKMQHESRLFIRFQRVVGHLIDSRLGASRLDQRSSHREGRMWRETDCARLRGPPCSVGAMCVIMVRV